METEEQQQSSENAVETATADQAKEKPHNAAFY